MDGDERQGSRAGVIGRQAAWRGLQCRDCDAVCELVVFPWRCLKERRACIYAFEGDDCTYVGCVHKVFAPEFDLAAFCDPQSDAICKSDPYGAVRTVKAPRSECPWGIERSRVAVRGGEVCVWRRLAGKSHKALQGLKTMWPADRRPTEDEQE